MMGCNVPLSWVKLFVVSCLVFFWGGVLAEVPEYPVLPRQFKAELETVAHLVDKSKDYPPWFRKIEISYDYDEGVARADILEGYEEGRTYIRHYASKKEYMIKSGEYAECLRSYLGEQMPLPELPHNAKFQGVVSLDGRNYYHWIESSMAEYSIVHIYQDPDTKYAVRVTEDSVVNGEAIPTMTYELKNMIVGPPSKATYDLPAGYTHKSCSRHLTGFPYIHAFHWYLRF